MTWKSAVIQFTFLSFACVFASAQTLSSTPADRKCHSELKLQQVPILVWTKHSDDLAKTFSQYLGAQDFLIKSNGEKVLRESLRRLLSSRFKEDAFTKSATSTQK